MYKYNTRSIYEDTILELKDKILELEVEHINLNFMNNSKSNQIKKLKGNIKELEEIVHNALNVKDKRIFNFEINVPSLTIQCIFGLVGLCIIYYRNSILTNVMIYYFQHYCM